jgi:hypothetical protein
VTALTVADREARDVAAVGVIADTIRSARALALQPRLLALSVLADLRAHGLFDHDCDDLCGPTPGDHHVCGEDGRDCDDECVCHGYSNDDEDERVTA